MEQYNTLCLTCNHGCKQYAFVSVIECPRYDYNGSKLPKEPKPPKSEYRELMTGEKTAIKNLVTAQCANYQSDYNICVLLDTACPMLTKHYHNGKLCKYFENAVLPLDKELEISLHDEKSKAKRCNICDTPFLPKGRQAYCSDNCRETANRKSKAKYMRKSRGK